MESDEEAEAKKVRYSSNKSAKTDCEQISHSIHDKTAKSLITEEKFLSIGCPNIDFMLKGGFPNRGITQIYGAAGTGKTQFALQLCLTVQIPTFNGGCEAGAVYICTEGSFPSRRLQELLRESDIAKRFDVTGDAIFVETLTELSELENCLTQRLPQLLKFRKIGLLVLDSIAAPYRAEYNSTDLKNRTKSLASIGHRLHSLAREYKLTIFCINQVSAAISSDSVDALQSIEKPTLGITWANMITNNFYLCRKGERRYFYAIQSSYLPRTKIEYKIRSSGVVGIAED